MSEPVYDLSGKRVWVAGHGGMVGSALVRRLQREGCQILIADRRSVDLRRQSEVEAWMASARPQAVFLAAAKVGGILANDSFPADFLVDNLMIEANVIQTAHLIGVDRLLFLGSSCIYPKLAAQPIVESALLTGPLEPTNEAYAIAKIAGIKLCQAFRRQHGDDFISAMPSNLYGPYDNFDLSSSHVIPALMRKAHEARLRNEPDLEIWGTGMPRREFMHVDDCADALVHLMQHYAGDEHVNVGTGTDVTIKELAGMICRVVGLDAGLRHDLSKPDGTPAKLMSAEKLKTLGWMPKTGLEAGLRQTYRWFLENEAGASTP